MPNIDTLSSAQLLRHIASTDDLIDSLQKQISNCRRSRLQHLHLLAARVKAGDSTGDELQDFCAVHPELMSMTMGGNKIHVAEFVEDLVGKVSRSLGEPMFIVRVKQKDRGLLKEFLATTSLVPPPNLIRRRYKVEFGILNRAELKFDLLVPRAFAVSNQWSEIDSKGSKEILPSLCTVALEDGNLAMPLPPLKELVKTALCQEIMEFPVYYEVVIGRKEVDQWLVNCQDVMLQARLVNWLYKLDQEKQNRELLDKLPPLDEFQDLSDSQAPFPQPTVWDSSFGLGSPSGKLDTDARFQSDDDESWLNLG